MRYAYIKTSPFTKGSCPSCISPVKGKVGLSVCSVTNKNKRNSDSFFHSDYISFLSISDSHINSNLS